MKIVCIGGGPAGLYFALLMKKLGAHHDITVVERNRPYDTFGWGVVFSDQTLGNLQSADAATAGEILGAFNHWDDIEVNIRGHRVVSLSPAEAGPSISLPCGSLSGPVAEREARRRVAAQRALRESGGGEGPGTAELAQLRELGAAGLHLIAGGNER